MCNLGSDWFEIVAGANIPYTIAYTATKGMFILTNHRILNLCIQSLSFIINSLIQCTNSIFNLKKKCIVSIIINIESRISQQLFFQMQDFIVADGIE